MHRLTNHHAADLRSPLHLHRSMPRLPASAKLAAAMLLLVEISAGVFAAASRPEPTLLDAFAREVRTREVAGVRLSIATGFHPCGAEPAPAAESGCGGAAPPPSRRALDVVRRAENAVRASADADALHTAALADIIFADREGKRLAEAISYLQSASRLSTRPAPLLADLAAAYLLRAERQQSPGDLFEAIEAADRALAFEPASLPARFNVAVALERTGLWRQAAEAWGRYLAADSASAFGREAAWRLRALSVPVRPPEAPERAAPPA